MNHRARPRVGAGTQRKGAAATGNLVSRRPGHPPRRSIVRGKLVSQIARAVGASLGRLLAELDDFVREPVDELLLLVNGQVQLIQQVTTVRLNGPWQSEEQAMTRVCGRFHLVPI